MRLEEEKAINRVLNGKDTNRLVNSKRSSSPSPSSRIPKFFGSNYMRVKDKIEKTNTKTETKSKLRGQSHVTTLTSAPSQIAILSR